MATTQAQFTVGINGACNAANKEAWKANIDALVGAVSEVRVDISWESEDASGIPSDVVFDYFRDQVIANERVSIRVERRA